MLGPHSSYSCLVIHMFTNVESDAKIEPPIQTEYFLSGAAITLTFIDFGVSAVISFIILSAIPIQLISKVNQTIICSVLFIV